MKLTVEHMLQHFQESPAGRKIISEVDAAAKKEREPKLARIESLRAEAAAKAPALRAAAEAASHRERDAEQAWRAAQGERWIADNAAISLSLRTAQQVSQLENELRAGVPAESKLLLDNFAGEMEDAWQKGRSGVIREERESRGWPNRTVEHWSNTEAVNLRQVAIRQAQLIARDLLPLAADVSATAIAARLVELRATIGDELPLKLVSTVSGGVVTRASDAPPSTYDKRGITTIVTEQRPIGGPVN